MSVTTRNFLTGLTNLIIVVIQILLGFRLLLLFLGAGTESIFVRLIYQLSEPLVAPFEGALPATALGGQAVIDLTTILAIIIYALAGWLISEIIYSIYELTNNTKSQRRTKEIIVKRPEGRLKRIIKDRR
jgi:uncharacterized protein YggT (Ycf19 family)